MNPVESFIDNLEAEEREISLYLHEILTEQLQLSCKLRYGIPFYDQYRWLCYINPLKKGGIELCFIHGRWMDDLHDVLQAADRKQIKGITIKKLDDIDEHILLDVLDDAIAIDVKFKNVKKLPK